MQVSPNIFWSSLNFEIFVIALIYFTALQASVWDCDGARTSVIISSQSCVTSGPRTPSCPLVPLRQNWWIRFFLCIFDICDYIVTILVKMVLFIFLKRIYHKNVKVYFIHKLGAWGEQKDLFNLESKIVSPWGTAGSELRTFQLPRSKQIPWDSEHSHSEMQHFSYWHNYVFRGFPFVCLGI